jgi:tetratricopeptide (TPR) repeat protein
MCRNVLIYLTPAAIAVVADKLARSLAVDGWLFVAPSDPRLDPHAPLVATVTDRGVFYRRTERVVKRAPVVAMPRPVPVPIAPPAVTRPRPPVAPVIRTESVHASRLADRGDYEGARRVLAASLIAAPLDAELHFLSAVLAADDDVAGSLAALDRAIYLAPEIPASYLFAGRLHQSRGDIAAARRAYRSALKILEGLEPDTAVPWADEPARLLAAACRQALESLDDR